MVESVFFKKHTGFLLEYSENPTDLNGSIYLIFFCGGESYVPTAGFVGVFRIKFSAVENERREPPFIFGQIYLWEISQRLNISSY